MQFAMEILCLCAALALSLPALGAGPTDDELATTKQWVAESFKPVRSEPTVPTGPAEPPAPGLTVLANYGPLQQNKRDGEPLRIADRTFATGLYCHAISRILVRLPGPGKTFSAWVGGETNGNYSGGSMQFVVSAAETELYRSPVLLRGQAGLQVNLDLQGATEFIIAVDNGGDNINSDQACWGDATVTLADGSEMLVGDMPLLNPGWRDRSATAPPFSFRYAETASDDLLGTWDFSQTTRQIDAARTETTQTYADPETGLQVRCVIVEYSDYPTVEWTLYLKNTGDQDTPILSEILPLDTQLSRGEATEVLLHHFVGSPCAANDYQPMETPLDPGARARIATTGGRPTNSDLPYFNIETGERGGIIAVISWAGQWAADFLRDDAGALRIRAGQERTRFTLHPGEEVRSPMAALQFYAGDWIDAQNVWRSWMVTHNIPQLDGEPIRPLASACNGNHYPGIITNAAEELHFLRRYVEEGIVPDFWWEDAGWYRCGDPPAWSNTGTWEVEPSRWPQGIREVSDWCRSEGIRTIVWFEPERVAPGTWLSQNHPEWILGGESGGLLNLGIPECRLWLTDHIDQLLTEQGIDLYRQDFNIDPLPYWQGNDTADRQGITEIKHVEGYFAYWDELRRRHPGMLIDSCASGGRRNDLETLRRAVPLLRSDYTFEPVGEQCHTYGISFWMPFNGTGFLTVDPYLIRSQMSPEFTLGVDTRKTDQDYELLRKLFKEWQQVSPGYFGDYYPLTDYGLGDDVWMAWQFHRPDLGQGFVQAFRRGECPDESATLRLRGLEADAVYIVTDLDAPTPRRMTGAELMAGFAVTSPQKPAALIFTVEKEQ